MFNYTVLRFILKFKNFCLINFILFFICISQCIARVDIQSYSYILQAEQEVSSKQDAIKKLRALDSDLIILDAKFSNTQKWLPSDLDAIRNGKVAKKVICYLSIGEAENYRDYWQTSWDKNPPSWLLAENPNWAGNFKVQYWNANWQKIILQDVDSIMLQGFDGLFLDIVDGFEFFEEQGDKYIDYKINSLTKHSYRQDMVNWIGLIAKRAKVIKHDAYIVPQNGIQLLQEPNYTQYITAQALEDLYTLNNKKQSISRIEYILNFAKDCLEIPILTTEYPSKENIKKYAQQKSEYYATILLLTNRDLTNYQ